MLTKKIPAELFQGPNRHVGGPNWGFHFVSLELPTQGISTVNLQARQLGLAKVASELLYCIL